MTYISQNSVPLKITLVAPTIDIFDVSMDFVASIKTPAIVNQQIEFIWNGSSEFGSKVNNGIYFCRLNDAGKSKWVKLAVLGD